MADIRAFHAMRYTKSAGEAKELTCPPYDIISEAERAAFFGKKPAQRHTPGAAARRRTV